MSLHMDRSCVLEHSNEEVVEVFNRCFEDYLAPLRFTPRAFEARMRSENLDPFASYLYRDRGTPVALVFVARRGWTSRVAAMAILAPYRGQGIGSQILWDVRRDAVLRDDRRVILEVVEENTRALRFYQHNGFTVARRLVGYTREADEQPCSALNGLEEIDPLYAAQVVGQEPRDECPWNLAPQTLAGLVPPVRAYTLEDVAFAIVDETDPRLARLLAIYVRPEGRRRRWGTRLFDGLRALYPRRSWSFTPLMPEVWDSGWFANRGWQPHRLHQLEMHCKLMRVDAQARIKPDLGT
jgi:ribosomal protein S18 acetylase RimI-like enzyme